MSIIHISDITLGLNYETKVSSPEKLINLVWINKVTTDLFLININYKTENVARADNAGILFLKYLRLNYFNQHCVLYSFLSREQLLVQDPHNSIIFSEGVTFIRLPEHFSIVNFESLAQKKAPEDLSGYFRGEIRFPEDERHNWANWWGIERLWEVHQSVIGKNKDDFRDYKSSPFIKKMESLESSIAKYLYPLKREKVIEARRESEILKLHNEITTFNNLISRERKKGEMRDTVFISLMESKISANKVKIKNIDLKAEEGEELNNLRNEIVNQKRRIVLIDDQAAEGWESAFKNILYVENSELQTNFKSPTIDNRNTFLQHINNETDIVLLDLRLKKEQGSYYDISQLSGVIILKKLIDRHPGLPVIIITASNKFRSYQTVMEAGADAYWVKEGLDSRLNENESFENYRQLISLISKLSGKEYKLLKNFSQCVGKLKNIKNPWWANHEWSNPKGNSNISVSQSEGIYISSITEILDYGVFLYRTWLKMFVLNSDSDEKKSDTKSRLLANIINTLSGIVELIHLNSRQNRVIDLVEIGAFFGDNIHKKRADFLGFYIYCMRNIGSHFSSSNNINYDFFEFYIKVLLTWLSVDYSEFDLNDVGIRNNKEFKDVYNPALISKHCQNMLLIQCDGKYKYNNYAQFYLNSFKNNENIIDNDTF